MKELYFKIFNWRLKSKYLGREELYSRVAKAFNKTYYITDKNDTFEEVDTTLLLSSNYVINDLYNLF